MTSESVADLLMREAELRDQWEESRYLLTTSKRRSTLQNFSRGHVLQMQQRAVWLEERCRKAWDPSHVTAPEPMPNRPVRKW